MGPTRSLPCTLRSLVDRALEDPQACEEAIEGLEAALVVRRSPAVLIALAAVVHREAEVLLLNQLERASRRALSLIDEALARGGCATREVLALEARCHRSLERERAREATLLRRAATGNARARDLVELADRLLSREADDPLAHELLRRADS